MASDPNDGGDEEQQLSLYALSGVFILHSTIMVIAVTCWMALHHGNMKEALPDMTMGKHPIYDDKMHQNFHELRAKLDNIQKDHSEKMETLEKLIISMSVGLQAMNDTKRHEAEEREAQYQPTAAAQLLVPSHMHIGHT